MRKMEVAGGEVIARALRKHPDLNETLMTWLEAARIAAWRSIIEVRRPFPAADGVPIRRGRKVMAVATVFNLGGNKHRLVALIDYRRQLVTVTHVLTHAEYDKESLEAPARRLSASRLTDDATRMKCHRSIR